MALTTQHFSDILQFLRVRENAQRAAEQRRSTRMDVKARIIVIPVDNSAPGQQVSMLTRDVSLDGIGLLSAVPLKKGQQFIALLPRNDNETVFVMSEVLHITVVADGLFSLGCRFLQTLSRQAAHKLNDVNEADVARIRSSVLK